MYNLNSTFQVHIDKTETVFDGRKWRFWHEIQASIFCLFSISIKIRIHYSFHASVFHAPKSGESTIPWPTQFFRSCSYIIIISFDSIDDRTAIILQQYDTTIEFYLHGWGQTRIGYVIAAETNAISLTSKRSWASDYDTRDKCSSGLCVIYRLLKQYVVWIYKCGKRNENFRIRVSVRSKC